MERRKFRFCRNFSLRYERFAYMIWGDVAGLARWNGCRRHFWLRVITTPRDIAPSIKDPVDLFMIHSQRQSCHDIAPSVYAIFNCHRVEYGKNKVRNNSMEFYVTSSLSIPMTTRIPWNFVELWLSRFRSFMEFHETARVIEIGKITIHLSPHVTKHPRPPL